MRKNDALKVKFFYFFKIFFISFLFLFLIMYILLGGYGYFRGEGFVSSVYDAVILTYDYLVGAGLFILVGSLILALTHN